MKPKILTTLKDYDRQTFLGDIAAGVTVAMVALPLSLAIAIASGASPAKGLVTAIVAGFGSKDEEDAAYPGRRGS